MFGEVTYDLTDAGPLPAGRAGSNSTGRRFEISYVPQGLPPWDPDAGPIDPDTGDPEGLTGGA